MRRNQRILDDDNDEENVKATERTFSTGFFTIFISSQALVSARIRINVFVLTLSPPIVISFTISASVSSIVFTDTLLLPHFSSVCSHIDRHPFSVALLLPECPARVHAQPATFILIFFPFAALCAIV